MDRANNTRMRLPAMDSRNMHRPLSAAGEPRLRPVRFWIAPSAFLQHHTRLRYSRRSKNRYSQERPLRDWHFIRVHAVSRRTVLGLASVVIAAAAGKQVPHQRVLRPLPMLLLVWSLQSGQTAEQAQQPAACPQQAWTKRPSTHTTIWAAYRHI